MRGWRSLPRLPKGREVCVLRVFVGLGVPIRKGGGVAQGGIPIPVGLGVTSVCVCKGKSGGAKPTRPAPGLIF